MARANRTDRLDSPKGLRTSFSSRFGSRDRTGRFSEAFARAMGTLVGNSVPLVQSLGIAAATLNNKTISGALVGVATGVKRGEGIAGPMRKAGVFPPLAAHLLTVGEETGRLDQMFNRMAEIYETDTRASIRRFTAIFEPVVILVMGVLIGALILSMLLAITSINDVAI